MPTIPTVGSVIQENIEASVAVLQGVLADRELLRGIEDGGR